MDQKKFGKIVERAQKDAKFLQALVFEPESMLEDLKADVDRPMLGSLIAKEPAEIVARTLGINMSCGNTCTSSCGGTCGQSCGYTTNLVDRIGTVARQAYYVRGVQELAYCGNTCTSSCDNTCGGSCGYTTNLVEDFGSQVRFGQAFR